ncbi:unnamed protein product [Clonostachys rosea f. rosea IK726]|uniref:FMP27 GFWDK domain-containing protein n=2 Tax=Bionectria ochroleuca TaxID=29856 RepID=A0A0B7JQT2_BIOOC|nr:unnamed protein product [Clonostachys rosea f. rosea IK726]
MALLNPTFVFGIFVLLYLLSFVLFALIRIVTGISIQRIGYLSLRRLAYTPKDGCRVEIRGLGFSVHRPTFAQPTWLSLVLTDLVVTFDVQELEGAKPPATVVEEESDGSEATSTSKPALKRRRSTAPNTRSEAWKRLTKIKEKFKRLHRKVNWLSMVDVVATNSTINVVDVGQLQLGSLTLAVDTRSKTADRARYFFQRPESRKRERQAEWILSIRSVLFTADGKESLEVLDHAQLNIHGFLYESKEGLRDASLALKLGRLHIPYDDMNFCLLRYKQYRQESKPNIIEDPMDEFLDHVIQETVEPGSSKDDDLIRTVSDSKEFVSSILRGIKEVQFAVSFLGLTKNIESVKPGSTTLQLTAAMKEVGIDLHRLDPKSAAHRMYFPSTDIAHEALAAALSISVGLDDGRGEPDRLLYVPMATTTVRTTLPSKTMELAQDRSVEERNTNIVFANSVITSPSLDIDPRHLPILIALLRPKAKPQKSLQEKRRFLITRLLPKAINKITMHEPVVRIKLTPLGTTEDPEDFDLIISSISSISFDMESSHSLVEDSHYSLNGALRLQNHHLYYQTHSRERFNLITTDVFDMKLHLTASPDVSVEGSGSVQSFSISMVRPEITDGLRQIVKQLRIDVEPEKRVSSKTSKHGNFLRSAPQWLRHWSFEATDLNVEVAGIDEEISDDTRGVFIHWDALSAEYRESKLEGPQLRPARTRTHSRSITTSDSDMGPTSQPSRSRLRQHKVGDGRRLVFYARGMEGQIIESAESLEIEPFMTVPRLELSFSAASDAHGPMFHIQASVRTIMLHYSLYRHYSIGVATMILRKAFMKTGQDIPRAKQYGTSHLADRLAPPLTPGPFTDADIFSTITPELVTADLKVSLVQVKAEMPHEPTMMLQVFGLEGGRHRWSTPYLMSRLVRLYVEPPRMHHVWARMVSIKSCRVDLRETKQKTATGVVEEKMIDFLSESMRIAVPHEVIVNQVTDNCVNVAKAVQQLHHRFKTGTNEYILEKKPEGPKRVPKVSLRARNFVFELEDGAFEWKLGMIYRTGRIEQIQRIARDEAFKAKINRIHEDESRRGSNKGRARSLYHRGRSDHPSSSSWFRSRSADAMSSTNNAHAPSKPRLPRYSPDAETIGISGHAKINEEDARYHLDMFNAQTWKKRIDRAVDLAQRRTKEQRRAFWGATSVPEDVDEEEEILEVPQRPALMSTSITDLHVVIDKPTFPMSELPDFLHKVGKGMPKDMKYGLLVPMHLAIEMDEARVDLRDYPLPLLHIPALKTGQSPRLSSVSLRTNLVIAEEYRGTESTRRVKVNIVPPKNPNPEAPNKGSFAIEVRRTIGPIKSFSDVYMDINTALPTRISWGPCYQPAIQDMMMVVESFTKPQIDPSERVGFWDKLRLVFHSRIHVAWKGDGDMHLALKGTRDPYLVTGNGAGFLMCWRNNIRWNINAEDDPKRFMTVDSGEYVLAVPDYAHEIRDSARKEDGILSVLSDEAIKSGAIFKKVVMKLSGKVQWMSGLTFERAIENGSRSFEFKPHYEIVLKSPQYAKSRDGLAYDSMRGFRSRHIHLSIAVRAPVDRDWLSENTEPSRSYNTVHLTPRFFTHFFAWWGLFGSPMSLPIRQGNLFPGREKNSKKFGRHLATVKYNLLLAPLYLSHIYKHKDVQDHTEDAVSATGLKVRFDSFMLDLHQRREEFNTLGRGRNMEGRTSGIKIHAAQLDLVNADLRAVSASLRGTTTEALKKGTLSTLINDQHDKPDLSRFTIPDKDYSWIDMDDFVELDWILPTEGYPETKILPLAFAPRLTYFRQTDIGGTIAGDPSRTSPFGDEPTHFCIMSHDDDPKKVQAKLIKERLEQLEVQMTAHARNVGEAELRLVKTDTSDPEAIGEFDTLRKHGGVLQEKESFLRGMLDQVSEKKGAASIKSRRSYKSHQSQKSHKRSSSRGTTQSKLHKIDEEMNIPNTAEFESEFNNRFILHNMQLKWNNELRNIVLRYIHQNSQRRGLIYYLSRPAVKFILDIVEEQSKARESKPAKSNPSPTPGAKPMDKEKPQEDIEDRIKNILGEGGKFHSTGFSNNSDGSISGTIEDLDFGISEEFIPQSSYHVRLIAPQIQLQSEKNKKHVVLITSKGMELKVVEVMDKERISDTVSGLVQRRFLVNMDSTQFFVTHHKWFVTNLVSMYAGSRYGTTIGSAWPPWVPMEVMFDFHTDPFGFKRVVEKTSAMLRYDKFNTLRLKFNDEVNADGADSESKEVTESRTDNLWVEFPQARALCNSSQYYALYVIVLDLLMYSEPLEKTRSERLEKIMLASDFSDLSGAPEKIEQLQERIRQMEEIKSHFQTYAKYLDERGWEDRLALERDLAACEDELFFVMKAITSSQRKFNANENTNALLKWSISVRDVVWHLIQDSNVPLVELQLKDLEYDRTDNSDGSHMNLFRVGRILGLNLLPDASYPEIIAPYHTNEKVNGHEHLRNEMIRVYWYMLEAIAGIPVMDSFEVDLFPMKIQLEREVGKRLFEYIFPGMDEDRATGSKTDAHNLFKQHLAEPVEDDEDSFGGSNSQYSTPTGDKDSSGFSTRAGSLELRLRPTLSSNTPERHTKKALTINTGEGHGLRLFRGGGAKSIHKKASYDSLRPSLAPKGGPSISRSMTASSQATSSNGDTKKRFGLRVRGAGDDRQPHSDDLTKMISRASNYMTFAYIRMPSVVLCLSYKGKDQRNFEDVHDFVFTMPTIEWQNKTWSNLDLALAVKRAVVRALISHTGAIIGNKFSKHRPNAEQRHKLRELANSSVLIAPSSSSASQHYARSINDSDDSSSMYGQSPVDFSRSPPRSLRGSTHGSTHGSTYESLSQPRSPSRSSSVASARSLKTKSGIPVPTFLTMTPPTPTDGPSEGPHSFGIDILRRNTSGPTNSPPRRTNTRGRDPIERPRTSASNSTTERKKSGATIIKDKLSALTHRMGHRESSHIPQQQFYQQHDHMQDQQQDLDDDDEDFYDEDEDNSTKLIAAKRLNWGSGRIKTG